MPTPVETARQCLTEEAARALDDAVAVAKRRNHAQTTSLHAVSALLSPSFSLLRESLSRARSSAYSPRLQFRALELCVGVSLDRLPSSKSTSTSTSSQDDDFAPPISNSLMAAIKRSQANQRRQPDMYHLTQITINNNSNITNNNPMSISSIKVELKHFVLSILDDPIVSRVFGEAGFRSGDIKLAIIHPPVPPSARWGPARCPPLFLCNLMDFPPFVGGGSTSTSSNEGDENCRRIGEVMIKRKEKNPLLVGVCAKDALSSFKDCLDKGKFGSLPSEIHGVKLVCLESEIGGFLGRREREGLDVKLKEVGLMLESSSCNGVVVNLGELKRLVMEDGDDGDIVKQLVGKISGLVEVYGKKKLWIIGCAANYETYSKFVGRFPCVEKDWDLHPLPITSSSSRSSFDPMGPKSSLMGSFVPFGGFFPTPADFRPPLTVVKHPFTRCHSCNEKYEQELCAVLREGSSGSTADQYSSSLPSWLQNSESDTSKGREVVAQVKDVKMAPDEKIAGLKKKWDDHCWHLHQNLTFAAPGVPLARPLLPQSLGFPIVSDKQSGGSTSSSAESSLNEGVCSTSSSVKHIVARSLPPQQKLVAVDFPKRAVEISEFHPSVRETSASLACPSRISLPLHHKQPPPISVTTDLDLGTIYASKCDELNKPSLQDHHVHLHRFSGSVSCKPGGISEKDSKQISQSSFPAGPGVRTGLDPVDYKPLFSRLIEAVAWQGEAISQVSQVVSYCKSGNGPQRFANIRRGIWLSFLGPDKIGKRRVAEALGDAVCGSRHHLIALDLSSQDRSSKANSLFLCQGSNDYDMNVSRITVVDHIAQELCKKPHCVVLLENIDEADPLVQNSLSRAIQTGRFQDSRGREISINNVIFITTSGKADDKSLSPRKEFIKFAEEKILEAQNWQMKIAARQVSGDASPSTGTRVSLVSAKCASDQGTSNKRKISNMSEMSEQLEIPRANKTPKTSLDLNLPIEEAEEVIQIDSCSGDFLSDDSKAWLEDLFRQTDGNVVFKPFDFDALADKLVRKVRLKFEDISKGERMSLEIDQEVMIQILAATWSSDNKRAVEDWIEQVLGVSFTEAQERYRLRAESVVRLSSCEGVPVREWASGICLPKTINLV